MWLFPFFSDLYQFFLITTFQASRGIDRQDALEAAKALVFEHPTWSTALGMVSGCSAKNKLRR